MSDSETDETTVKSHILNSFCFLESYEVKSIQQWIGSGAFEEELETKKSIKNVEKQMRRIGKYIKKMVPFKAELPTEKVAIPTTGEQADCTPATTLHVDQFLYEQYELDNQIAHNVMPSHYCGDCNSRNIKRMTFISHSMSKEEIGYTFKVFFPRDLENKTILDIGSRFGTVLYGAYYLTNATCIIGVEINSELCEIQTKIVERFGMDPNRVRIVNSDILLKGDIVAAADAITMNAIDFFVDVESHIKVWGLLKQHMKKGSYLIYKGIVENTLRSLNIYDDFVNWVTICQPCQLENEIFFDVEDGSDLAFYIVN